MPAARDLSSVDTVLMDRWVRFDGLSPTTTVPRITGNAASISLDNLLDRFQIVDIVPKIRVPDVCDVVVWGVDGVDVLWLRG
jgi:hypothetical protein